MTLRLATPDFTPTLKNVRGILTTKWQRGYRPLVVDTIESYYMDSSLDNDSDTWNLSVGDPEGKYLALLERDNEVRVEIIGVQAQANGHILSGIADEIVYDDQGTVNLSGRDMASLALDSFAEPRLYKMVKSWAIIGPQARQLGFPSTSILKTGTVNKTQRTDGSETYWEFWYRLIRKDKMWLWCAPNGTLVASRLNYEDSPSYYFGTPKVSDSNYLRQHYIPVEKIEIRKNTQSRVAEVWVYAHRGDNAFIEISKDPTMGQWVKRPRRFLVDTDAHTATGAQKLGWEEIFEGKVGSIEIKLTIAEPGFMVLQNRVAMVRIPQIGFAGKYFVVGVRSQADTDGGLVQEVRLRELQYALTRRVPSDPKVTQTQPVSNKDVQSNLKDALASAGDYPEAWGMYFYKAAKKWHGPWDFNLYLAVLIATADHESSFQNIRQHGVKVGDDSVEWYPRPGERAGPPAPGKKVPGPFPKEDPVLTWKKDFVNEPGDFGITDSNIGVGPMQLTFLPIKHEADEMPDGKGKHDQYGGNRWNPEYNIMAAAHLLRECLQQTAAHDAGSPDSLIWLGVSAYNRGPASAFVTDPYAISIKNMVYNDPGYLQLVGDAISQARASADAAKDDSTEGPVKSSDLLPQGLPTEQQAAAEFQP